MSTMPHPGLSPVLNVMSRAAQKASRRLIRDFGEVENLQVSQKGPGNFVTSTDHAVEEILLAELQKARPNYGFVMEERGEITGEDFNNTWIIDPIDGTTNFMHGLPHFAISIALKRQEDIIAGMVYNPVTDEMFFAEKGKGAFLNNRRLRVANRRKPESAMLGTGLSVRHKLANLTLLSQIQKIGPNVASIRCLGSTSLDLCYVAAGRLDGFWHVNFESWDVAAGALIVHEAGGYVSDSKGSKDILEADSIVASNEFLQPTLCKALDKVKENVASKAK